MFFVSVSVWFSVVCSISLFCNICNMQSLHIKAGDLLLYLRANFCGSFLRNVCSEVLFCWQFPFWFHDLLKEVTLTLRSLRWLLFLAANGFLVLDAGAVWNYLRKRQQSALIISPAVKLSAPLNPALPLDVKCSSLSVLGSQSLGDWDFKPSASYLIEPQCFLLLEPRPWVAQL